ncbi:hypothetical protein [Altererythrobacter sp. GH1-8]|uniref:hypothetical protein n=1 Tax=Altererythrobacter sp. GH1-8 TaxID=3349333 RepID=UPI00374D49B2
MFEQIDWWMVVWTGAVFLSGYLIGSRRKTELAAPLDFDLATISPSARAQIEHALQNGQKIEAIRILREDTGLGLKDSKTVIDMWR